MRERCSSFPHCTVLPGTIARHSRELEQVSGSDGREDLGPSNGTMLDEDPGPLSESMQHLGAAFPRRN